MPPKVPISRRLWFAWPMPSHATIAACSQRARALSTRSRLYRTHRAESRTTGILRSRWSRSTWRGEHWSSPASCAFVRSAGFTTGEAKASQSVVCTWRVCVPTNRFESVRSTPYKAQTGYTYRLRSQIAPKGSFYVLPQPVPDRIFLRPFVSTGRRPSFDLGLRHNRAPRPIELRLDQGPRFTKSDLPLAESHTVEKTGRK